MSELVNLKEFCEVMQCGETKARELLRNAPYGIKIGGKWFAHRRKLTLWLDNHTNDRRPN